MTQKFRLYKNEKQNTLRVIPYVCYKSVSMKGEKVDGTRVVPKVMSNNFL